MSWFCVHFFNIAPAIEADGYDYKVDEQRIQRYFDMKDLTYKCEVETVYIDNSGSYFATSNIF